jgi:uncharacterized membrane protein YdfJ with MMPL/SSD domain
MTEMGFGTDEAWTRVFTILGLVLAAPIILALLGLLLSRGTATRAVGRWSVMLGLALSLVEVLAGLVIWAVFPVGVIGLVLSLLALHLCRRKASAPSRPENLVHEGPRCVACSEPIALGVLFCPKCGWTQPA